jgi:predicted DCC family thiol-disulfide oxidoreductase YuxK
MREDGGICTRLAKAAPYRYRTDPAVPAFPDDKVLVVFDGVCVLCSGFARFILTRDGAGAFQLATAQSPLGQALYRHFGLDVRAFESNLVLSNGRAYAKLDTLAVVGERLGGAWRLLRLLRLLPRCLADRAYDTVASNRFRWFGRHQRCMVPALQWQERFIGL